MNKNYKFNSAIYELSKDIQSSKLKRPDSIFDAHLYTGDSLSMALHRSHGCGPDQWHAWAVILEKITAHNHDKDKVMINVTDLLRKYIDITGSIEVKIETLAEECENNQPELQADEFDIELQKLKSAMMEFTKTSLWGSFNFQLAKTIAQTPDAANWCELIEDLFQFHPTAARAIQAYAQVFKELGQEDCLKTFFEGKKEVLQEEMTNYLW